MAISLMLSIHVRLTLYALLPFPLLTFLISRFGITIHRRYEKVQAQFAQLSARLQENLSGIRVIKAYTREDAEIESFRKENENYFEKSRSMIRVWSVFFPIMEFMGGVGVVIVLWYGGIQVIKGVISLGDFVAFNGYLLLLLWPVIALGWVISLFQRGAASMKRMKTIFNTEPDIRDNESTLNVTSIKGDVFFRKLTFTYKNSSEPVLRNIDLHIEKGTTIGIVGPTGSGKTTLVNLIPRIFDPPENRLYIDDVPVEKILVIILVNYIIIFLFELLRL